MRLLTARPDTRGLRQQVEQRRAALITIRAPWLAGCIAIAEELVPTRLPYLLAPGSNQKAGEHNTHIMDSVGHVSVQTSAAGIGSGTMPPDSTWFELVVRNLFGEDDELRAFLQQQTKEQLATINQSNVHQALINPREEWLTFGIGAAIFQEDDEDVIRLDPLTVGEYCIAEDSRNRVDTLYRDMTMTVAQLAQEFGEDALCPSTRSKLQDDRDFPVQCVHAIEPDPTGENPEMPWRSIYYETTAGSDQVLAVRGFRKFPVLVWRWTKLPGTPYATGRGLEALPHLVRLRKMIIRYGQAMAQKADPSLQVPSGLAQQEIKRLPGSTVPTTGQQTITNLMKIELELNELGEEMERTRQQIRDVLGATLVASLRQITHQMTAHEVATRTAQDLLEFLPQIYRQNEELLERLQELTWDARMDAGLIGPLPMALLEAGAPPIDIEYTSPLARKQLEDEVRAIVETFAIASEMSKAVPDVVDNLNADEAIRRVSRIKGMPVNCLEPIEKVRALREARQKALQAEKTAAAAQQGAEIAKTANEAQNAVAA